MTIFVGVDVGATHLVVAWRENGRVQTQTVERTAAGCAELVKKMRPLKVACIVLEATGVYYLDVALTLAQAALPVSVINPRSFHHFARMKLTSSKTDTVDAALLAEYAERMNPPPWQAPSTAHLALRDLGRQINRLTATRTQAKNRLHALRAKHATLPELIEDEQDGILTLDRRIERLLDLARQHLAAAPDLACHAQHLQAAKGIAAASAVALLAELCVLPKHLKANQVSRHAGLDVRLCQSGTSINKPGRLSKAGNAYLRSALYMPALSAAQHDPNARAFYQALQRRGKKKMQALCALMRKLLTGIWACLQRNEPFDASKLFSDVHLAGG